MPLTCIERLFSPAAYFPLPISNRLRSLAKGMGTNLSRILAGATAAFLHRLTGESDVLFGLPMAARDGATRCIPGMVSNVLPLRLSVHPDNTLGGIADQVASEIRRNLPHQHYQLADFRRDFGQNSENR